MSERLTDGAARSRDRRSGPARGRAHGRARDAARRPVRRPADRRHGRRGDQDRAAGQARSAARVGPCPLPRPVALVARAVAQQEVHHAQPAREAGPGAAARAGPRQRRRLRELPPRHARALEPRLRAPLRGQPRHRARAHLGLRADRALRRSRRLRLGRRGHGRPALHQRLPGRGAAAHRHLARRLARGDVRDAGDPRRALPARRPRRRPRPGRRRLAARVVLRAARGRRAGVRPARRHPRARRHRAEGRGALEHLQVAGRQVGRDRREPGQRLPPAVRGDGHAGARHRRPLLDPPRARREPGGDRGDHLRLVGAPSGGRDRRAS